jgi:hypothetical protein
VSDSSVVGNRDGNALTVISVLAYRAVSHGICVFVVRDMLYGMMRDCCCCYYGTVVSLL